MEFRCEDLAVNTGRELVGMKAGRQGCKEEGKRKDRWFKNHEGQKRRSGIYLTKIARGENRKFREWNDGRAQHSEN